MKKVIIYKGLPGCGKSTHAREVMKDHPNTYKRVNKDDIRAMLDGEFWSRDSEKLVLNVRDAIILQSLENGKHVIVDDTNLAPKHETRIRQLVKDLAEVEILDFTGVPVETCIKNDLKRSKSVGEKVIRDMYKQFLEVKEEYKEDSDLPHGIIVDIDGTLAHMNNRSPFDWGKVGEDTVDEVVKSIVNAQPEHKMVIIMSGRDEICREDTVKWLNDNGIRYDFLYMRPQGNNEKDSIIKKRLFEDHVRGNMYVDFVLDDRNQVVNLWRNMGLKCLQVQGGDF